MASITERRRVDGTTAFMVRWHDPVTHRHRGLTVRSEDEASRLMRGLNSNGQSLECALRDIRQQKWAIPTVGQVVQEHIDLLVRPSSGSMRTYQKMLDLHIQGPIGAIALDAFGYRDICSGSNPCSVKGPHPKPFIICTGCCQRQ